MFCPCFYHVSSVILILSNAGTDAKPSKSLSDAKLSKSSLPSSKPIAMEQKPKPKTPNGEDSYNGDDFDDYGDDFED